MLTQTATSKVELSESDLAEVQQLYDRGLYLQAYQRAESFGPIRRWRGHAARVLAGRIAILVGAARLGFWLHSRALKEAPNDPRVCYFYGLSLLDRKGPLAAWRFLQSHGEFPNFTDAARGDWLSLYARVAGRVRDFDAAAEWLDKAEQCAPNHPWIWIERSALLEYQDRVEESLEAAQRALQLRPWYRPGVQSVAHSLQLLDRDQEALDLLAEADRRLECGYISLQLAILQVELGMYADARRAYSRYAELSPLLDKKALQWLASRQCEAAYLDGDYVAAANFARQAGEDDYHKGLAERLSKQPLEGKRHVLPVGFVRQHHKTCAPATLTSISRFWSMPADHLEIAERICYDGTPAHSERRWAEENGWEVREFTVTWDSTVALLDRGIPFTLTFAEPTFSHLQACIGYDSNQQSFLIRDPGLRYFGQFNAEPFLKRYKSTGPRGMAMVPKEKAALFDGLELPDAELYDQLYEVDRALQDHDRTRAEQSFNAMKTSAPDHRLTWTARQVLAAYDADHTEILAAVDGLLKLFPDDVRLQLNKLSSLRDLARREERLELLKSLGERADADPVFQLSYAQELAADARQDHLTERLLKRVIRRHPVHARAYSTLGDILWGQRRFEEALQLYRWAVCLEDKDEHLVQKYFTASRHLGQSEVVLEFLRNRFHRFGTQSSQPIYTYFWACCEVERRTEAFAVLDEALSMRSTDGELMLFAAKMHANHGEMQRAADFLAQARNRSPHTLWLRTAAHLALVQGEHEQTLGYWRQVIEVEPVALDAHREIVTLLAEMDRGADALEHLRRTCEQFPHHFGLHQIWIEWTRSEGADASEPIIRKLVEIHSDDAWARRELAVVLSELGKLEEALAEADTAIHLDPSSPFGYTTRALVHLRAGRKQMAQEDLRQAIHLSVDCEYAIREWLATCDTMGERREVLADFEHQLQKQVTFGTGLLAFRDLAWNTLEPGEVLALLRRAHQARPDLWQSWSALINQLLDMQLHDEALELANEATNRFPLLPALWLDLSRVRQLLNDIQGEIDAIRRALHINRSWGAASRLLAAACRRAGKLEEARSTLETAQKLTPLDYTIRGYLADILWELGEKDAAMEQIQQALRLAPGYDWGWMKLAVWSRDLGKPEMSAGLARDLTIKRPREARSWLMLARVLAGPENLAERLAALDKAIELNPRCGDAYDLKAELLALERRYDEAITACHAPVWNSQVPLFLRGRIAWIEAQRGDVQRAMAMMRDLLKEDPAYYWGWSRLADWTRDYASAEEYLEAANMLVRLAPDDGYAYGYQGEARLRTGDRPGAKQALHRALELMPDYHFAGLTLYDLYYQDNEVEAAAEVVAQLQKYYPADPFVMARGVEIAAKQANKEVALHRFRELCFTTNSVGWPLDAASAALNNAGWFEQLDAAVNDALADEKIVPKFGRFWVRYYSTNFSVAMCERRLPDLLNRGELGKEILAAYVQVLGERFEGDRLRWLMQNYEDVLRRDTECWALAGYGLEAIGDYEKAASWMADYDRREGLQPWMLLNLAIALRALGRDIEAATVSNRALELPEDQVTRCHRVWLALDGALAGSEASDALLATINEGGMDTTHRFLLAMVQCLRQAQRAAAEDRTKVFAEVRQRMRRAAQECCPLIQDRKAVERVYVRFVKQVAKDIPSLSAKLWSWWHTMYPLLPSKTAPVKQ